MRTRLIVALAVLSTALAVAGPALGASHDSPGCGGYFLDIDCGGQTAGGSSGGSSGGGGGPGKPPSREVIDPVMSSGPDGRPCYTWRPDPNPPTEVFQRAQDAAADAA
ncbi:MAG: hypothetical protein HYX34_04025 [Actinobacteria bacterium]|nr:hypothetical protein [Actinomycetota bacterium]